MAATIARLGIFHLVFIAIMEKCTGDLPSYFPALNSGHTERDELIERYFKTGLGYDEILLLLGLLYGIALSRRLTELSYRNAFFWTFQV